MLLCGHADLAAVLVHFVNDGVLRFQLIHAVGKHGVVLVGIQQIHHNYAATGPSWARKSFLTPSKFSY